MRGSHAYALQRYLDKAAKAPKPPTMLTAAAICRSGLLLLQGELSQPPRKVNWPPGVEPFKGVVKGLYGVLIYVDDAELRAGFESFLQARLIPAVEVFADHLLGVELGGDYLLLPLGVTSSANERYGGVAMRCIIMQDQPVGERDVPGRHWAKYYDVACDEFKEGYCTTVVSLWVHTPDTDARLLRDT